MLRRRIRRDVRCGTPGALTRIERRARRRAEMRRHLRRGVPLTNRSSGIQASTQSKWDSTGPAADREKNSENTIRAPRILRIAGRTMPLSIRLEIKGNSNASNLRFHPSDRPKNRGELCRPQNARISVAWNRIAFNSGITAGTWRWSMPANRRISGRHQSQSGLQRDSGGAPVCGTRIDAREN